jgi:general secretion pathway protein N
LLPSLGRMAREGAALVLAASAMAFAQILSVLPAGAQPAQDSSPLVMIDPATSATDTSADRPKRTSPVASDPAPGGNPLWSLPLSALSVTRERPIFSPSRRPPPSVVAAPYVPPPGPPPPPPKPPGPDHPLLTLLGTLAGDSQGVGIFLNEADKSTLRLRTGEAHDGWILRSVRSGEATFENGDRTATLALSPLGSAAQASASWMPFGNTWRDGDGQIIGAPPISPLPPPAVAPTGVAPAL